MMHISRTAYRYQVIKPDDSEMIEQLLLIANVNIVLPVVETKNEIAKINMEIDLWHQELTI